MSWTRTSTPIFDTSFILLKANMYFRNFVCRGCIDPHHDETVAAITQIYFQILKLMSWMHSRQHLETIYLNRSSESSNTSNRCHRCIHAHICKLYIKIDLQSPGIDVMDAFTPTFDSHILKQINRVIE